MYQNGRRSRILPLIDENNCPVFEGKRSVQFWRKCFSENLDNRVFDENFKKEVEGEIGDIMEGKKKGDKENTERWEKFLNHDTSMDEIERAIQHLKKAKSPDPDEVYTKMLKIAGNNFLQAILRFFQMSWKKSEVPLRCKKAKSLWKNGKKIYHDPGAYRPKSLTS